MAFQVEMTRAELDLLIELVEAEQRELPTEVHHTHTPQFREQLRARLDKVGELLLRLQDLREDRSPFA